MKLLRALYLVDGFQATKKSLGYPAQTEDISHWVLLCIAFNALPTYIIHARRGFGQVWATGVVGRDAYVLLEPCANKHSLEGRTRDERPTIIWIDLSGNCDAIVGRYYPAQVQAYRLRIDYLG
jgi:hypothetical protein